MGRWKYTNLCYKSSKTAKKKNEIKHADSKKSEQITFIRVDQFIFFSFHFLFLRYKRMAQFVTDLLEWWEPHCLSICIMYVMLRMYVNVLFILSFDCNYDK